MGALYEPATGAILRPPFAIADTVQYYTYDVQYLAGLDRFLAVGTHENGDGFAYLFDDNGMVVGENLSLPPSVREAQPAIRIEGTKARAVYPQSTGGVMVLSVTGDAIGLEESIDGDRWQTMGTDGFFAGPNDVYFVSLSTTGLVERTFTLGQMLGDMDLDGDVDFDDVAAFVLGLRSSAEYEDVYGVPPVTRGDLDGSGRFDFDDIDEFVALLRRASQRAAGQIPEPAAARLAALAIVLCGTCRSRRGR